MGFYLPGSGEVKRVDETEWRRTGCATRSQIAQEVAPELRLFVDSAQEDLLVFVLEGEVEGLGGEVSDDVGGVTTPVSQNSLFFGDADETVYHTWGLNLVG